MKLKTFTLVAAATIAAATFTACSGQKDAENAEAPEIVSISVDSLLQAAPDLVGDTVTVSGTVKHLCAHGGTKAFIYTNDSTTLLMCMAPDSLGAFPVDMPGATATIVGIVQPMTVSYQQVQARVDRAAEILKNAREQQGEGHCSTEQQAFGDAKLWLDSLNNQIAAGGDSTLTVGYYLQSTSFAY